MSEHSTKKPSLYTVLSPSLLHLYDLNGSIVVVIDVLRATSTIATALYNGAESVIPVTSVDECIQKSEELGAISAGERDGKIAEGMKYGNSPFTFPASFVSGKTVVLTTTNGTRLLHMALEAGAEEVVTGAFSNLSSVCNHLTESGKNVILACAAWRDKINLEDSLFAGAVINRIKTDFDINCDASMVAETLYDAGKDDLFRFMASNNASHYNRLMGFGLEKDLRYCLSEDQADVLPVYRSGKLIIEKR